MRRVTAAEALERLYLAKVALIPRLLAAAFAGHETTDAPAGRREPAADAGPELRSFLLACADRELDAVKRLGHRLATLSHEVPIPEPSGGPESGPPGRKAPRQTADWAQVLLVEALGDAQHAIQAVREGDVLTVDLLVDLVGEERQAARDLQTLRAKRLA